MRSGDRRVRALLGSMLFLQRLRMLSTGVGLRLRRLSLRAIGQRQVNAVRRPTVAEKLVTFGRRIRAFRQRRLYPLTAIALLWALMALPPVSIGAFNDSDGNWRQLLMTFWVVSGSVVALAIAVNVFVFQIFASRSRGQSGTLLEFAFDTFLFDLVVFGVAGLLIAPLFLYGSSESKTGGWGALVLAAALWIPIALLPLVFRSALVAIEGSQLEARRRRNLIRRAREHVEDVAVEAATLSHLTSWVTARNIQYDPWPRDAAEGDQVVVSERAGIISDIDLHALEALQSAVAGYAPGQQVRLLVRIGQSVSARGRLLIYPTPVSPTTRQIAEGVVTVRA